MNRTYDLSPLFILKCNFATIVFGKKDKMTNNYLQNTTHKTKDCATRIPLKERGWNQVLRNWKQFMLHC
jgi:hypothetical protein